MIFHILHHNRLAFLPLAFMVALALMGCPNNSPSPCSSFVQQQAAYPGADLSYGVDISINADAYSSATLRPGDKITLNFDCVPALAQNPTTGAIVAPNGNAVTITMAQSFSDSVIIDFTTPNCSFTIHEGNVWPGDANADGRRNMHDLMPICYGIRNQIALGTVATPLSFPPVPAQMHALRLRPLSGKNLVVGGDTIDLVHADCNLDGLIDTRDIAYLMAVLVPALPPNYLVDKMQGIALEASMAEPPVVVLTQDSFGLRIPFEIKAGSNTPMQNIFGISFTRSLTEMAGIRVAATDFVYQPGDVFFGPDNIRCMRQRFWDDIDVAIADTTCISHIDKPLDVAMFALSDPVVSIDSGARIGNCNITLLDVMRTANPAGQIPLLFQHITGGIAYTYAGDQGLVAHAVSCSIDSASVDMRAICRNKELILRDGDVDDGLMPNAKPEHAFISPDIWLRHNQDGLTAHQMVKWGTKNWLYVRLFNKSCDTLHNATVDLRYCPANSATQFPTDFSTIGNISIPMVAPWGSAIASIQWTAPTLPSGLVGIPVPSFVARTSFAAPFNGPLVTDVVLQNAVASRSSFQLDGGTVKNPAMALIELRLPAGAFKKGIVVEQVDGPLDHPASKYGSFEFVAASGSLVQPGSTVRMTAGGTTPWSFSLNPGATSGAIVWNTGAPAGKLGIRFRANSTQPNFSTPVQYHFRVYMTDYATGNLTVHNSSIFELTIP
jgi:hypothetical protein